MDLMNLFEDTESVDREEIIRAPFGYPGSKLKSTIHILPHLPYTDRYVEVFGGSGAVLLARRPSQLEVFNDRYAGVVAFYRCLRDPAKLDDLCDQVRLTVHSREEFVWARDTWKDCTGDVDRAFRWYYMVRYSFGQLGRNFGRCTAPGGAMAGKIINSLEHFPKIHQRLKRVQIENLDWERCLHDYDHPDTVFYLDPPYIDATNGIYKHELSKTVHRKLVDTIFNLKGFVALSGYPNPLYDNQDWDDRITWDTFVAIRGEAYTEENKKKHLENVNEGRGHASEVLWIKEAR
jgi:DNA adenine methylase